MEKVNCMSLSFIHIHYNHSPVQALSSLAGHCAPSVKFNCPEVVLECYAGFPPPVFSSLPSPSDLAMLNASLRTRLALTRGSQTSHMPKGRHRERFASLFQKKSLRGFLCSISHVDFLHGLALRSRAAQSSLARVSEMQTGTLFLSV